MRKDLIAKVELQKGCRFKILQELKIPRSTYYKWRKVYQEAGIEGLKKARVERRIWNRLGAGEVKKVLEVARVNPELSSRTNLDG